MRLRPILLILSLGLLAVPVYANAAQSCTPISYLYRYYQEVRELACAGKFNEVEEYFARHQARYEAGETEDRALVAAYHAFELPFPTEFFAEWLKRYPASYSAHVAAARSELGLGWVARGTRYAAETSREQFAAMHRHFTLATDYLQRSLSLTKKPYASYEVLIQLERHNSRRCDKRGTALTPDPCLRGLLDKALEIDPRGYWVRRHYLDSLQPRWGGSFAAMDSFADETQKAGLPDWQAKRFRAMVLEERTRSADKPEEKLKLALMAYELNHSSWNISEIMHALIVLRRYSEVLPYAKRGLELSGDHLWVMTARGYALWELKRDEEACADFLAAARKDSTYGQYWVGRCYWHGRGLPKDPAAAVQWWQKAAAKGNKDAVRWLDRVKTNGGPR